jgi:hypothetical protein
MLTDAEKILLKTIRGKGAREVTVALKEGSISHLDLVEDIPGSEFEDKCGAVSVRNMMDYESVTIVKHQGIIAKAIRRRRVRVKSEKN